jgi:4-amino-4-deoxy-L-arabinose transferase-like glycosyltransferase
VIGLCLLALLFAWWLRSPLHHLPLERDEGSYALIATRWLAGAVPYRDLFDHKPPLIYLVYALARLVPSDPVGAIRIVATLYLLASGLALLALGWRLYGRWAALAALMLFLVYGSSQRFEGLAFNSEAVMLLPATLSCLLLVLGVQMRHAGLLGLAGICVGLTTLAKPVGAGLLLPLCLGPLLLAWPLRRRLAALALGLAGALLPLLLSTLYFWWQRALPAAYEALIIYNRIYAAESLSFGWNPLWLWRIWQPMLPLVLPGLVGLVVTLRDPSATPAHTITAAWGLTLLATALLSLRDFPHYYLAAVPAFSLWAGALISTIVSRAPWRIAQRSLAAPLGLMLLAGLLAPAMLALWPLRSMSPQQQIQTLYADEGVAHFWPAVAVAGYIAAHVPPGQPIFIWATEPQIYYLADRRPAVRFPYDYPIDRLPGARDEVLAELRRAPPPFIVTYRDVRPIGFYPFADDYGYRLATRIGGFDLFQRGG